MFVWAVLLSCGKSPENSVSSDRGAAPRMSASRLMSYNEAVAEAKKEGKTVLIDFYADWCKYCKKMDETTMSDSKVMEKLSANFVRVRINTDRPEGEPIVYKSRKMTAREFSAFMQVPGLPSLVFLDKDENVITLIPGFIEKDVFIPILNYISYECYKKDISFDAYMSNQNSCRGKS